MHPVILNLLHLNNSVRGAACLSKAPFQPVTPRLREPQGPEAQQGCGWSSLVMYANLTDRVTQAVQGECQGAFPVTRPRAVSPETGASQVGGRTAEWLVQSY